MDVSVALQEYQEARERDREALVRLRAFLMARYPGAVLSGLRRGLTSVDVACDLLEQYEDAQDRGRVIVG